MDDEMTGIDPGGDTDGADFGYDDFGGYDGTSALDPFADDFGVVLESSIADAVQQGVQGALGTLNVPDALAGLSAPDEQRGQRSLSEEDLANVSTRADAIFDEVTHALGGDFDRQDAFDTASEHFAALVADGVPVNEAINEAMTAGAYAARTNAQAEHGVDKLLEAEMARVGAGVNAFDVRNLADAVVDELLQQGVEPALAVSEAIAAAATHSAGHELDQAGRWGGRNPSTEQLVGYFHRRNEAQTAAEQIGVVPAPRPEPIPGQRLSTTELLTKHYGRGW